MECTRMGVVGTSMDSSRKFALAAASLGVPSGTHRSGGCAIIDAGLALPAGNRQADLVAGVAAQARSAWLVGVAGLVLWEGGQGGNGVHGWVCAKCAATLPCSQRTSWWL